MSGSQIKQNGVLASGRIVKATRDANRGPKLTLPGFIPIFPNHKRNFL